MDESEDRIRKLVKLLSDKEDAERMAILAEELDRLLAKSKVPQPTIANPKST